MTKDVVYDSINTQVWYEGDISTGKNTSSQVYGKHYKKFANNHQARAYAISLAKRLGTKVYDKYFGKYLKTDSRTETLKSKIKNKKSNPFGLPTIDQLMRM